MAHVQKFSRGSASRILGHCEREKNQNGAYLKYKTNSDIDISKTHLNVSLEFNDGLSGIERLKKRLSEVFVLNRKDVNVLCDFVITLPATLVDDEKALKSFFNNSYRFLSSRYGEENTVSAVVHFDETTPHMHYCFVPVCFDEKKNRYKVSAKDILTKKDLQTFHTDLAKSLEISMGLDKSLVTSGITKEIGGNKSVLELKNMRRDISVLKADKKSLETKIEADRGILNQLIDQTKSLEKEIDDLHERRYSLKKSFWELKDIKEFIEIPHIKNTFREFQKNKELGFVRNIHKGKDFDIDL